MKTSNYNVTVKFDNRNIIYNTLSRRYVLYDSSKKDYIDNLLNKLNEDRYEISEGEILKKFIKNAIIIDDKLDEFQKVSYAMNKTKYQDGTFILVIVPTLDCNFRCVYCYEKHEKFIMNDEIVENLIDFVKDVSKNVKRLLISWFGGEPMLQFEKIKKLTYKFKEICKNEGCNYSATMTTNGYLFTDEKINELEDLGIERIQITLDGDREEHNKKRHLEDGSETFDKILDNIIKIAEKNIKTVLRINFDENNKDSIPELFEKIPKNIRKKLIVNISNVFQNDKKVNPYNIYKVAIDKGYKYDIIKNNYALCEVSFVNSLLVHPDGKVTSCQMAAENGLFFGKINKYSKISIFNDSEFFKMKTISALNNEKCKKCNVLPMCLGGCPNHRYKNNNDVCMNKKFNGMNLEDVVRLHVYNDIKNNIIQEVNII